jgi:hypothetical protein
MLLVIATFFALCIAYVAWCDRIIGPDTAEVGAEARTDASADDGAGRSADEVPA